MTDQQSANQKNTKPGIDSSLRKETSQKILSPDEIKKKLDLAGIEDKKLDVVDNLNQFENALNLVKLKQIGSLEVTKEIFDYLSGGQKTPFINYKGIRVYEAGTKSEIERMESLSLDAISKIKADEWRANNPDKCL